MATSLRSGSSTMQSIKVIVDMVHLYLHQLTVLSIVWKYCKIWQIRTHENLMQSKKMQLDVEVSPPAFS